MDAEARLNAFFAATQPPTDYAFTAAVMQRVERRRLAGELAWTGALAAGAGVALWALSPLLHGLADAAATPAAVLALALGAIVGAQAVARRLGVEPLDA